MASSSQGQPAGVHLISSPIKPVKLREIGLKWRGPIVAELPDDFVIRELQFPEDYILEGTIMGHCLNLVREHYKEYHCYSLQDKDGLSHVTIVLLPTDEPQFVYEIRGRWNAGPRPDYRVMVQAWLDQEGIKGDDLHMPYDAIDNDQEYHEDGIIRAVITSMEGVYN